MFESSSNKLKKVKAATITWDKVNERYF